MTAHDIGSIATAILLFILFTALGIWLTTRPGSDDEPPPRIGRNRP